MHNNNSKLVCVVPRNIRQTTMENNFLLNKNEIKKYSQLKKLVFRFFLSEDRFYISGIVFH